MDLLLIFFLQEGRRRYLEEFTKIHIFSKNISFKYNHDFFGILIK